MLRPAVLMATVLGLVLLPACGDSTRPEALPAPIPSVAGTYALSGTFDDSPGLSFAGPITITQAATQASRDTGALGGTATVTLSGSGENAVLDAVVTDATITRVGEVTFSLSTQLTASWRFTGTLAQGSITGRQTVNSANGTSTGPWRATRQ